MVRKTASLVALCLALYGAQAQAATFTVDIPEPSGTFEFLGSGNASVTYGGVTFSQSAALSNGLFFNVGSGYSGFPPVVASQQQTVGVANILVTLPQLANAITINYGTYYGSTVNFTLSNGFASSFASGANLYNAPNAFSSGLQSLFSTVQLTAGPAEALHIRSITFSTPDGVPEPATWAMLILGFALVGGVMRRQQSYTVRYNLA